MTERRAAGFTLLEVTVALAITGLALGFAIPAISDGLTRAGAAIRGDQAVRLAESLLARTGQDIPLADGTRSGEEGGLAWTVAITPWTGEGDGAGQRGVTLHRVAVRISGRAATGGAPLELVTLRLAPAP